MRTIKFRAWNSDKAVLAQVSEIEFDTNRIIVYGDHFVWGLHKYTLEQYTGVDDFYGNQIYEGDILNSNGTPVVVDFRYGVFGVQLTDDQRASLPFLIEQCETQAVVIGNIHENPELLEAD